MLEKGQRLSQLTDVMQQRGAYDRVGTRCLLYLHRESSGLVLSNRNALAKTADVQSGCELAIESELDGSF